MHYNTDHVMNVMMSNHEVILNMYDKIVLEVVGYDETHWQIRYPHITDECFWIPKESFLVPNAPQIVNERFDPPRDSEYGSHAQVFVSEVKLK